MKKEYLSVVALLFALCIDAQNFIHPGMLHTQADLDRTREKVEAGEEPWASAYKKLLSSPHVDLDWIPAPVEKLVRGGRTIWEADPDNYQAAYRDVATAYQCALVWHVSGNAAYADKAVQILNAWARTCKKVSGDTNACLAYGLYGYQFANAAELMRDYPGWDRADFERFKEWMLKVWYHGAIGFLQGRNGTQDDHYWSNWGLCNVMCAMSIGILCDDIFIYNQAAEYYKYMEDHRYGESLHHLVWKLHPDERGPFGYFGQMQESNRDQGHAAMALALAADLCGTGRNQGDDFYALKNDRIVCGFEYVNAYNSGVDDLPNSPYTNCDGTFPVMGDFARGTCRPAQARIVNYYENIRGIEVPYTRKMLESHDGGIEGGGRFGGGNSGGYDQLGFTTLTCSLDPLEDKSKVPTILSGKIAYDGREIDRPDVNCIPKGSVVVLTALLPEGEADTGLWTWDDNPECASPTRTVTLDASKTFRVHYTNAQGVANTQLFALHVEGEGWAGSLSPYYKMEGGTGTDTLVYVKKNKELTIGVEYADTPVREWKWDKSVNGKTWSSLGNASASMTFASVSSNAYYRVTMVNQAGVRLSKVFRVEVSELDPFVVSSSTGIYEGTSLAVERGATVALAATPNSLLAQSVNSVRIYHWTSEGDTLQSDTLTFHLNAQGGKVADLSDTLYVGVLDTCAEYSLHFRRVSSSGSETSTLLHFHLPVYESNTLEAEATDSFYLASPQTGKYLRNTDATFVNYDETADRDFLWRIREMPLYGHRYMIVSQAGGNKHLSDEGKLVSSSDYSKHSFNLLRKCSDEDLYAIGISSSAGGGFFAVDEDGGTLAVDKSGSFSEFPLRITKKVQPEGPDAIKDIAEGSTEREAPLVDYAFRDGILYLQARTDGVLKLYDLSGCCLQTQACKSGENRIQLQERVKGVLVGTYRSADGKWQNLKFVR